MSAMSVGISKGATCRLEVRCGNRPSRVAGLRSLTDTVWNVKGRCWSAHMSDYVMRNFGQRDINIV